MPYLLTAIVGMLLINSLSMYSAGFTAQTMGVKLPRAMAVSINAVISLVGGLMLMLVAKSFLGSFITFLILLAVSFSAWIGVYAVDMFRRRTRAVRYDAAALMDTTRTSRYWYKGGYCWQAMVSWVLALALGLAFTKCDWFAGPFSSTPIGKYGLAWAATIVISAAIMAVLPAPRENTSGTPEVSADAKAEQAESTEQPVTV